MTNTRAGGIVIGRFMPPHAGHCYLIDFARAFSPDLTVFVCTLTDEPIPGNLRFRWMSELFPTVRLVHITDEIPQASRAADGAQNIWAASILDHLDGPPQYVFASEEYGVGLAEALGAKYVPVDPRRSLFPVSAGSIRSDPLAHWEYIPRNVRPYFVCRVSVVSNDPRSIRNLAREFDTIFAADYLSYRRQLSYPEPTINSPADLVTAQAAGIHSLPGQANRVLFLESDLLRTILSTANDAVLTGLAEGMYDDLLEETRPDLVIALSPLEPAYAAEIDRRGWPVRHLDASDPNIETDAAMIVRELVNHHRKNGA